MVNQKVVKISDSIGAYIPETGKYRLHNGLEFDTVAEVKSFIKGLEYGKGNANIGVDTAIENAYHSLANMEMS